MSSIQMVIQYLLLSSGFCPDLFQGKIQVFVDLRTIHALKEWKGSVWGKFTLNVKMCENVINFNFTKLLSICQVKLIWNWRFVSCPSILIIEKTCKFRTWLSKTAEGALSASPTGSHSHPNHVCAPHRLLRPCDEGRLLVEGSSPEKINASLSSWHFFLHKR